MTPAQGGRASLPAPLRALTLGSESHGERLLHYPDCVGPDSRVGVRMVEVTAAALVLGPLDEVVVHAGEGTSAAVTRGAEDELVLVSAADRLHTDPRDVVVVDTIRGRKRLVAKRFHAPPRSALGSTDGIAGAELVGTPVRRLIRRRDVRVVSPHAG